MILIFSNQLDYSTDEVIRWLSYYSADVLRINVDDEAYKIEFINQSEIMVKNSNGELYNLLDASAYWYRRGGISNYMINYDLKILERKIFSGDNNSQILKNHLNAQKEAIEKYIFWKIEHSVTVSSPFLVQFKSRIFSFHSLI